VIEKKFDSGKRGRSTGDRQRLRAGWKDEQLARRQAEADARNEAWRALSPSQQIASLLQRSGRSAKQIQKILDSPQAVALGVDPRLREAIQARLLRI
jgi:hypothetical protein